MPIIVSEILHLQNNIKLQNYKLFPLQCLISGLNFY